MKLLGKYTLIVGLLTYLMFYPALVSAASPTLSKAYKAISTMPAGSIVRVKSSNTAIPANLTDANDLLGVTESNNGSLLAINQGNHTVQVAISGTVETLVSTVNGNIASGSPVALSPFGGMGMRSSYGDHVIGLAQATFTSNTYGAKRQTIKNTKGQETTVSVGLIPVSIAIGIDNTDGASNGLQRLAYNISGHVIQTWRIVLALVIAVVALGILISLVYAAIYGSLISIGRNPLAKGVILASLSRIAISAVFITIISGILIYLLLH